MTATNVPDAKDERDGNAVSAGRGATRFRARKNNPRPLPRGYESVDSIVITEPRIEAIRRELQALLEVVSLEADGRAIEIDGFRLRDPAMWADYPTSLSDIFWHLSSVCNFNCDFCYEKGNPPDFPIQDVPRMASDEEIETRLRHYDPERKTGIFTVRSSINEPFANRNALRFLRAMRERSPDELISFVTNGSYLTEDVVRGLSGLQPLFFNLSLYSTDPAIRRDVLRDLRGAQAVEAVERLKRHQIPFMTNLVMWPSIPFQDMERTIHYMADNRATVVRVCLGGYSKYLPMDIEPFRADDYWPQVVREVERIRNRYEVPILIEPNSYVRHDTEAWVDGVIRDSPAQRAGIRRGDCIVAVDGERITSRMQLLSRLRRSGEGASYRPPGVTAMLESPFGEPDEFVGLEIRSRDGHVRSVRLERYEPSCIATYPYGAIAAYRDFMYGLVLTDCLRYSALLEARTIMARHGARKVLVLSSTMVEPMVRHMLDRTDAFGGFEVALRVARNGYFGGTINIGDLLVVEDFIEAIRRHVAEECGEPDLVLIPASPFSSGPWGRDLTGRPWTDIERAAQTPVELIPCATLTF
jgi:MoaA/NifB/PqqE/SkfB family radical SAM enzyme